MKIPPKKYAKAFALALEKTKDPKTLVRNLLELLRRRKQMRLLPKILDAFEEEWNREHGVMKLRVAYPEKYKDSVRELENALSKKLGKKLQVETKSSGTLIGGFRLRLEDMLIDASIETRLKTLASRMVD